MHKCHERRGTRENLIEGKKFLRVEEENLKLQLEMTFLTCNLAPWKPCRNIADEMMKEIFNLTRKHFSVASFASTSKT